MASEPMYAPLPRGCILQRRVIDLNGKMGGDHGHHHHQYKVPDWKIYKVENCPKLLQVQEALAAKGLKDPWLRNEAWRFAPEFKNEGYKARLTFLRGIQWGFAAFLITIAVEKLIQKAGGNGHEHGHGHH